jgi:hypothetical protein
MINLESKPTFGFKIVFKLPESEGFHHKGEIPDLILPQNDDRVKLGMIKKPDSEELDTLFLKAGGFPSENDALNYASKIKNAIYISALLSKNAFKIIQLPVREEGILYFGGSGIVSFIKPLDNFLEDFSKAVELSDKLEDKQSLALEFFNISLFESSPRAGYISLITAIEVLAEGGVRDLSTAEERCIEKLKVQIDDCELGDRDKNFLKKYMEKLRKETRSESCRNLIKDNLGESQAKVFNKHYRIRSALLHGGIAQDNFEKEMKELREIVSNLLINILKINL